MADNRIYRLPQVRERTGLATSTIYLHIAQGRFPRPVRIGPRAVGWREADLDAWEAALPCAGNGEAA